VTNLPIRFPLLQNESGSIPVILAASMIPLLLFMGGAVDIARYSRYKVELSNAVDSAALALARNIEDYNGTCPAPAEGDPAVLCEAASEDIAGMIAAFDLTDSAFSVEEADLRAERTSGGFIVTAQGQMDTMFLPLGNLSDVGTRLVTMDVSVLAQALQATNRLELALVIDNTGSMNCGNTMSGTCYNNYASPPADSRIVAVKAAATTLVNTLMHDNLEDPEQIKIALVPFEGMVNVGITSGPSTDPALNWVTPPSWIDWNVNPANGTQLNTTYGSGRGKYAGVAFDMYNFSTGVTPCTRGTANCDDISPAWLYRQLNIAWAGCVEMRPYSATASLNYELTDITPSTSLPDSLFVPYFWPDEPDTSGTFSNNAAGNTYTNNYLSDRIAYSGSSRAATAQSALAKYYPGAAFPTTAWHTGAQTSATTPSPYTKGPNRGCPNPIVPLTRGDATGKQRILDAIDDMVAYYATGTYIPTGLMWGWHVLSPTVPFTEGLAPGADYYEDTIKAMVLFTDGDNTVNSDGNHNGSRFSAWGYIAETDPAPAHYRLGNGTTNAEAALNTKTATACANAKAGGIRIYAVSFGSLTTATRTMMENCASDDDGEPLYYHAPTTSDLDEIFAEIGEDLREVHLSM
jgi:hypothetical protein